MSGSGYVQAKGVPTPPPPLLSLLQCLIDLISTAVSNKKSQRVIFPLPLTMGITSNSVAVLAPLVVLVVQVLCISHMSAIYISCSNGLCK